jgi:hypothetical protein
MRIPFLERLVKKTGEFIGVLFFSKLIAEGNRQLAETAAQMLADADRHERAGATGVANYLREQAARLSLNVQGHASELDAGVQYLLGPDESVMPALPVLPAANGDATGPGNTRLDSSVSRPTLPARRGPGRPPKQCPSLPEPSSDLPRGEA